MFEQFERNTTSNCEHRTKITKIYMNNSRDIFIFKKIVSIYRKCELKLRRKKICFGDNFKILICLMNIDKLSNEINLTKKHGKY